MLESTQRSVFRHYPVSNAKKPSADVSQQFGNKISYYVSPEDTTENRVDPRSPIPKYETLDPRGILKAVFWIAVSTGLSLLIGNLC